MFPNEGNVLVARERHRDLLSEAEHKRLIQIARHRPPYHRRWHWIVANRLGDQMVKLGQKLQDYGNVDWPRLAGNHLGSGGSECSGRVRHVQPQ